jgi:hypothetical protein
MKSGTTFHTSQLRGIGDYACRLLRSGCSLNFLVVTEVETGSLNAYAVEIICSQK